MKNTALFGRDGMGEEVILKETFDYPFGSFCESYSPEREFHYYPKQIDQGPWTDWASHHLAHKYGLGWEIKAEGDEKYIQQTGLNLVDQASWKFYLKKYLFKRQIHGGARNTFFPMLAVGETAWSDVRVDAVLATLNDQDYCGMHFRSATSRQHYMLALKNQRLWLVKRDQDLLITLCSAKFAYVVGERIRVSVRLAGDSIECSVDGKQLMHATDASYSSGRVGLISNVPARYYEFSVTKSRNATTKRATPGTVTEQSYPQLQLAGKIKFPHPPSGRSLRFGDLKGNGNQELLVVQGTELKPDHNAVICMSALNLQGEVLWQVGQPQKERKISCSDFPVQIYDIDGDGKSEVICCLDFKIKILDGETGAVKKEVPTPIGIPKYNRFDRILGDCIMICNLRGLKRPQDFLLKDRYSQVWAYDNDLNLLWTHSCNTGHFPYAVDFRGTGRDQILCGYTFLDSDGSKIWDVPLHDHADAVAVFKTEENRWLAIIAASDDGIAFVDPVRGKLKRHLKIGHMQTVTVAKLGHDLGGVQIATNTYWGNPGINYILNPEGEILEVFQPFTYGSLLYPVNWRGDGAFLLLLTASTGKEGGLYDGKGQQKVAFPNDGHPILACAARDLLGDDREELLCWDYEQLWIYTQANPAPSPSVKSSLEPKIYNDSNYRAYVRI